MGLKGVKILLEKYYKPERYSKDELFQEYGIHYRNEDIIMDDIVEENKITKKLKQCSCIKIDEETLDKRRN